MTDGNVAHALVYAAPGQVRLDEVAIGPPGDGEVTVRTICSGLSRGTERLVFNGAVPQSEWSRMRAPLQEGDFPFPVRYGYAAVGEVEAGPADLCGQTVFVLHPHQSRLHAPAEMAVPVPDVVPPGRAILGANMETALNAVWDARLRPGQRVLVVGAGLLGWLITALLSRRRDLSVSLTDVNPEAGALSDEFGITFLLPQDVRAEAFDVAFHCSASAAGLDTALDALGFEGTVIELSWYGDKAVPVHLGRNFHANRLQVVSSQVGRVAPARRASTTRRDRLALALGALADPRLDLLITTEVYFTDLPDRMADLLAPGAPGIATRIVYD